MEKQYLKTPFDKYFEDVEKGQRRKVEIEREDYKKLLKEKGLTDEKLINKLTNAKHPMPKDIKDTESKTSTESVKEMRDEEQLEIFKKEAELIKQEKEDEND
jgi:hypothetical protein